MASFFSDQLLEQQADIAAAIAQPLWQKASAFAAMAHAGEVPPDEVPPSFAQATRVAVMLTAVYHCQEPPVLATALLHNVLDKTNVSLHEIENHFGRLIASRVERLSHNPNLDESIHLKRLSACDWQTRLVKLADAAANLDDEGEALEDRIHKTMPVLDLAFGNEQPVRRAQRHLMSLLANARMAA